jgi:hypothetical protein
LGDFSKQKCAQRPKNAAKRLNFAQSGHTDLITGANAGKQRLEFLVLHGKGLKVFVGNG